MDSDGAAGSDDGAPQPGKSGLLQHPVPRPIWPQADVRQPGDACGRRYRHSSNRKRDRGLEEMDLVFYSALTLTLFLVLALIFAPVILRPSPAARRMLEMVRSNRPDERNVGSKERMQEAVLSMARGLRIRLGITEDEKVKQQLLSAGVRTSQGMTTYVASRYVGPVLGLVCGSLIHTNTVFWALSLAAVCYLNPDMWLKTKVKKRRE